MRNRSQTLLFFTILSPTHLTPTTTPYPTIPPTTLCHTSSNSAKPRLKKNWSVSMRREKAPPVNNAFHHLMSGKEMPRRRPMPLYSLHKSITHLVPSSTSYTELLLLYSGTISFIFRTVAILSNFFAMSTSSSMSLATSS